MEYDKPIEPVYDVVGKSTTVFYAPLNLPEPEKASTMLTEPDTMSDEVEANLNTAYIPDDDELEQYRSDADITDEISQGLTFQEISQAIDVVEGRVSGEAEELLAAETLSNMPDDFLNVICMQANQEAMVKKLISGYLDFNSKMKSVQLQVENFDINKYV
jgi:hypothetical protein